MRLRCASWAVVLLACQPLLYAQTAPGLPNNAASSSTAPSPLGKAAPATPPEKQKPETSRHAREADDAYIAGARSMEHDDVVTAEKHFARALQLDPSHTEYAVAIAIARQHHVVQLVHQASEARLKGDAVTATRLIAEAQKIDPKSNLVTQHLSDIATLAGTGAARNAALQGHPAITDDTTAGRMSIVPGDTDPSGLAGPINLQFKPGKQSFHFRSDVQDVMRKVLTSYGISPTFDSSVLPQSTRLDIDNVAWPQALFAAQMVSNTFIVPLDSKSVLVLKDTPENRTSYEHLLAETVFLPALTPTQMSDMGNLVRTLFGVKQATVQTQGESLSIRAPQPTLNAINHMLDDLLDGGSELLLEMHLYEVDRSRTQNTGLSLPQQATVFNVDSEAQNILNTNQSLINQLIASGAIQAGNIGEEIAALVRAGACGASVLCQPFATFGGGLTQSGLGFSGATINLALNSSSARSLDDVQMRVGDHQTAIFRSGTSYPIVTSSYSGIGVGTGTNTSALLNSLGLTQQQLSALGITNASAAIGAQPIPQVQYEDLGLTLKASPVIQMTGDVSLHFDLKLEALSGASLDGNPVLISRQFTSDITTKEGTSTVIASSMSKTESTALSGLPGFTELPGFFDNTLTDNNNQVDTQELVLIVTPHIIRRRRDQLASPMLLLPLHEIPVT